MIQTTKQTENPMSRAAAVLSSAALMICWGILDYFGIWEVKQMGNGAKDCYMRIINDEVNT